MNTCEKIIESSWKRHNKYLFKTLILLEAFPDFTMPARLSHKIFKILKHDDICYCSLGISVDHNRDDREI